MLQSGIEDTKAGARIGEVDVRPLAREEDRTPVHGLMQSLLFWLSRRGLKVSLGTACWWYRSSYGTDFGISEIAAL